VGGGGGGVGVGVGVGGGGVVWRQTWRGVLCMLTCPPRTLGALSTVLVHTQDCNALLEVAFEEVKSGGSLSRSSIAKTRKSFLASA